MPRPDQTLDRLRIVGLTVSARIGVRDWEQQVPQRLRIDIELPVRAAAAAATDALEDAVDYGAVSRRVSEFAAGRRDRLIETLAERIAALVLAEFAVPWVSVTLHKPGAVPNAEDVVLTIERRRG